MVPQFGVGVGRAHRYSTPVAPGDDFADDVASWPAACQRAQRLVGRVGLDHQRHADAAVEDPVHFVLGHRAQALNLAEDLRLRPGRPVEHGAQAVGQHPGQVAHDAAAGDVGAGVQRIARCASRNASTAGV